MNVPDGWRAVSLGELAVQARPGFASGKHSRIEGGVQHLRPMNITRLGRLDLADAKYVEDTSDRRVALNDVIFNNTNSPALIGKTALITAEGAGLAYSNHMTRLRMPREGDLLPAYLGLFLHHLWEKRYFESICSNHVNQASVGARKLLETPVSFPPLPEQRRIVEMVEEHMTHLDAADATLASAEQRISGQLASVRHMAWSEGAHVPLTDVAAIQGGIQKQGKRAPVKNIYPFLRVANVTAQGLDLGDVHRVELFEGELERLRLASGDLLVVEGNGSASQIGRAALWDGSIPDCVHQNHLIRVRADSSKMAPAYLELVWNSPALRAQLTDVASSSSGLHTLSVRKLKTLRVPCPPLSDQERLVTQAAAIIDRQQSLRRSLNYQRQRSAILRQAILAAAFSGHLTSTTDPSDLLQESIA